MRELISTVTAKGQITLTRKESVVDRTAGIFKTTRPALTAEKLREAAEQS